jgi:hypothetical protein
MSAHALTNGFMFYFLLCNIWIGILETILHLVIDVIKCENRTNPIQDQALHHACMSFYVIIQVTW